VFAVVWVALDRFRAVARACGPPLAYFSAPVNLARGSVYLVNIALTRFLHFARFAVFRLISPHFRF
jgi:hypothetical protein